MRTPVTTDLPTTDATPALYVVDGVRLDRAVHYVLLHTQHRSVNKAIAVDAADLDAVIDLFTHARALLHAKHVATSPAIPHPPADVGYLDPPAATGPHLVTHRASGQTARCGGPGACTLCDHEPPMTAGRYLQYAATLGTAIWTGPA